MYFTRNVQTKQNTIIKIKGTVRFKTNIVITDKRTRISNSQIYVEAINAVHKSFR